MNTKDKYNRRTAKYAVSNDIPDQLQKIKAKQQEDTNKTILVCIKYTYLVALIILSLKMYALWKQR